MRLDGKTALITGAGVRLGRALALALAERGTRIVAHYHASQGPAETLAQQIAAQGGQAVSIQADLRDAQALQGLIQRGVEAFGGVDILINSAALFQRAGLLETTETIWDDQFAVNLKAPFFLAQAFARALPPDRRGHIINLADWSALRPGAAYVAYYLTKAGLVALTQSLALALGPQVQVNAIAPGAILPPPGGDEYFKKVAARIPARRVGSPEEIVKAALYLLDSDFVTGEVLLVTGGEHL